MGENCGEARAVETTAGTTRDYPLRMSLEVRRDWAIAIYVRGLILTLSLPCIHPRQFFGYFAPVCPIRRSIVSECSVIGQ